jgi:hypothetical protein
MKKLNQLTAIIIATLAVATSAMAKIGETYGQILTDAKRDKDTVDFRVYDFEGRTALGVRYRDGAFIRHVFGTNGREIAFYLFSPKRVTQTDIGKIQRMFHTTWRSMGKLPDGSPYWKSGSGLTMALDRRQSYDYLCIFDMSRIDEIPGSSREQRADRAAPTPDKNDCLIVATEAQARLKKTAYWSRVGAFMQTVNGKNVGGHAVAFFQPNDTSQVFMYDEDGSLPLHTQSHDLTEIIAALNRVWSIKNLPVRAQSPEWVGDEAKPATTAQTQRSTKDFVDAANERYEQWKNSGAPAAQSSPQRTVTPLPTEKEAAEQAVFMILWACILAGGVLVIVICFLKGKPVFGALSILALFLRGSLSLWAIIGAIRIAKPHSWWARRYYGPEKMNIAHQRFTPLYKDARV